MLPRVIGWKFVWSAVVASIQGVHFIKALAHVRPLGLLASCQNKQLWLVHLVEWAKQAESSAENNDD